VAEAAFKANWSEEATPAMKSITRNNPRQNPRAIENSFVFEFAMTRPLRHFDAFNRP
jgi:hypothetical protein